MDAPHFQAETSMKLEAGTKQESGLSPSEIKTEPGFKTEGCAACIGGLSLESSHIRAKLTA